MISELVYFVNILQNNLEDNFFQNKKWIDRKMKSRVVITSRTCKSAFEWLNVELRSLNIFIVSARGVLDSDWLNNKCVVLPWRHFIH